MGFARGAAVPALSRPARGRFFLAQIGPTSDKDEPAVDKKEAGPKGPGL